MKKRIFLVISLIALMLCMLTIVASAEEFTVNYNDGKAIETTNEDGVITLRDTIISNVNANKTFYGWYTKEGDMYKPGETITLTKDTNLYEAYGYPGTNKSLPLSGDNQWDWPFIQLQENIVLDAKMSPPWGGCATVDLNGFTITTSAQHAVNEQRSGIRFVGEGSVIHTGTGNFFNASSHGYGDGSQYLLIGKNVTVTTNGTLLNYTNDTNSVIPIHIFGNVICNKLFHITKLEHNLDVQINPDRLEVTGDVLMTVGSYNGDGAKVSINIFGGNIVLSSSATELNYWHNNSTADNASRCYITITQGAFSCGDDAIKTFVPDGYKTTVTEIGGVKYTNVVKSTDCSHE
ncbi:MAG: InlB B-repeat-containing protein, partial [Clostridia bacterium]|nr:InlB B-repeat-containing protein [Clostridia bacterium]